MAGKKGKQNSSKEEPRSKKNPPRISKPPNKYDDEYFIVPSQQKTKRRKVSKGKSGESGDDARASECAGPRKPIEGNKFSI